VLMTELFYAFARPDSTVFFPGAAMIAGAVLTVISAIAARISLKKNRMPAEAKSI
jgi:MFS transporter, DHA1 family, tetracycline resistance protein